jgi:hypothetical protein
MIPWMVRKPTREHPMPAISAEPSPPRRPRSNVQLQRAPRCGARTRAGCPCQAPAIRGKLRCRMHGGRSTGPRTPEGLARLRAARTIHGRYSAAARAEARHVRMITTRVRLLCEATRLRHWLPAPMTARLMAGAAELGAPPDPGWGRTPDRATEAAALGPWRAAIAAAKEAKRAAKALVSGGGAADGAFRACGTEAHTPVRGATDRFESLPEVHAPVGLAAPWSETAPKPPAPALGSAGRPAPTDGGTPASRGALLAELARRAGASGTATPQGAISAAERHAPERGAKYAPAAHAPVAPPDAQPEASRPLNRAQRRRLKALRRRMRRSAGG